jgi:hypothetical protein
MKTKTYKGKSYETIYRIKQSIIIFSKALMVYTAFDQHLCPGYNVKLHPWAGGAHSLGWQPT